MQYYENSDRNGRRAGVLATVLYFAVIAVLLIVIDINMEHDELGEGILIDFGDVEMAGGNMSATESESNPSGGSQSQGEAEELMTQNFEEAPAITREQPRAEQRPSENQQQQQQQPTPVVEQPREVDRKALFPGSGAQNNAQSQGDTQGEGRQGSTEGVPGGNPDGSGAGNEGTTFSLSGRSIIGSLPLPHYGPNKRGHIIVDITVDVTGKVIRVIPRGHGSTTNDAELINAAIEAARKAKFNVIEGDGLQTGTITYKFILK